MPIGYNLGRGPYGTSFAKYFNITKKTLNVLAGDVGSIEEVRGGENGLPVGGLVVIEGRPGIIKALLALNRRKQDENYHP